MLTTDLSVERIHDEALLIMMTMMNG